MATVKDKNILRGALRSGGWLLATAFSLSFVFNVLRLTGPLFMLLIYDRVLTSRSQETLVALFILVTLFLVIMGLIDYSRRRILGRFGAQFQERVEDEIFNTTSKDKFFVKAQSKPATGLNELDNLRGFFHSNGLISIFDFVWAPMFLIVVFSLHWVLGGLAVAGLGLLTMLALAQMLFAKGKKSGATNASKKITHIKEAMRTSRDTIRSQDMVATYKERWVIARRDSRDRAIEHSDWSTWFSVFSRQLRMMLQYSVLATGAYLTLKGELTIGAMVACTFLVMRVLSPTVTFLNRLPAISDARKNWASLDKILSAQKTLSEDETVAIPKAVMTLQTVWAKSSHGMQVLKGISLDFGPGELIEIIGPSSSGKTILAEILVGVWPKSAGSITCGGINLDRLSAKQSDQMFGYVPEAPSFITGTIAENISRLELEPDVERIHAAAKLAQVHDMIIAQPDGYQSEIDAVETGFSSSQRHQLSLARALYSKPRILVIDEPGPNFRKILRNKSGSMLERLRANGCTLIILSRMSLALPHYDASYTLEGGRLKQAPVLENVTNIKDTKADKKITKLARG